jgi:hypothetical protein
MGDLRKRPAGRDATPAEAASVWPGGPAALDSPPTGYGASKNESVQVTIGTDGLVDTVKIDPRALRQDAQALSELTRQAVREAQQDWFCQLAEHDPAPGSEDRLRTRLEEIHAEYSHRMEEINRVLAGLMRNR